MPSPLEGKSPLDLNTLLDALEEDIAFKKGIRAFKETEGEGGCRRWRTFG
ncbi:MAG: hypothetical protein NZ992_02670 [Candidatus Korarchaeum sp.]|nr:hypothetical protein [Candidatus Korarchaeum sp.]MDW8036344.1 hypothetical protein [Candidatus Korarchaeum sp.]